MQSIDQNSPKDIQSSEMLSPRSGLLYSLLCSLGAGLTASLTAVLVMGLLRLLAGIPTPVELFSYFTLNHIDVDTFIRFLTLFHSSKTVPLGLALLSMIALGTLLGLLYATLVRLPLPLASQSTRREWIIALLFSGAMTLAAVLLFWDEIRQNLYGLPLDWSRLTNVLGLLLVFFVYGMTLCLSYRILLPKSTRRGPIHGARPLDRVGEGGGKSSRRQLLSRVGVATLAAGSGAATAGLIRVFLDNGTSYDGQKAPVHNGVTA